MGMMVSRITSRTTVYSTVYSSADKKTSKLHVTGLCEVEFTSAWWIPCTEGQWCGTCFHLMMSSCIWYHFISIVSEQESCEFSPHHNISFWQTTARCNDNMVQYNMIPHTALYWLRQHINISLYSQKYTIYLAPMGNHGVSIRFWETLCYNGTALYPWLSAVHDGVIKWKPFPCYWPFVQGVHRSSVNSPCKGQWHGANIFFLIYAWINRWVNNGETGDLRCYHTHNDIIVVVSIIT